MKEIIHSIAFGLVILVVATGCDTPEMQGIHNSGCDDKHRVLIIPFSDAPGAPGSGQMLTHAFYYTFVGAAKECYEVIDTMYVKEELFKRGKSIRGPMPLSLQDELANELGADTVITGQTTVWNKGSLATSPMVGFTANCRSVSNSTVLWSISHTGSEFFMGVEERIPERAAPRVCKKAIKEAIKKGDL